MQVKAVGSNHICLICGDDPGFSAYGSVKFKICSHECLVDFWKTANIWIAKQDDMQPVNVEYAFKGKKVEHKGNEPT